MGLKCWAGPQEILSHRWGFQVHLYKEEGQGAEFGNITTVRSGQEIRRWLCEGLDCYGSKPVVYMESWGEPPNSSQNHCHCQYSAFINFHSVNTHRTPSFSILMG